MVFMDGKKNPSDWYSRHPEDITEWSERQMEKHDVDSGAELRLNRVIAIRKLEKFLHEAGIDGTRRYSEEDIRKYGLEDLEYTTTRRLIEEGKGEKVELSRGGIQAHCERTDSRRHNTSTGWEVRDQ